MITLAILVLLALGGLVVALAAPLLDERAEVLGGSTVAVFALTGLLGFLAFGEHVLIYGSFEADKMSALAAVLLSLAGLFVAWGNLARPNTLRAGPGEFFAFLLWGALGGLLMVGANNLLLFFLGLELASYAGYVIAGYDRDRRESAEGATKYLVLGAVASAILLYGMALVYAATGQIYLDQIRGTISGSGLGAAGLALILVGLGFKLALVPFHAWVPDAYQGARPVGAAFLASTPKVGVALGTAVLLARAFAPVEAVSGWILALAFLSFVLGNLWAMPQENLKRLLGYSTVAHMGYLALGLAAGGTLGFSAAGFYLLAYLVSGAGAFLALEATEAAGLPATLAGWKGLFKRAPFFAVSAALLLLSLAGVPLLSGFLAKLYVFSAAVQAGWMGVVVVAVLTTILGYYYYFRVLSAAFLEAPEDGTPLALSPNLVALVAVLAALSLLFGLWPAGVMQGIQAAVASLFG